MSQKLLLLTKMVHPKSKSGKRDIPLNITIKGVLAAQKNKLTNILPMNDSRIFVSVYGSIVNNHAVNSAISTALDFCSKFIEDMDKYRQNMINFIKLDYKFNAICKNM